MLSYSIGMICVSTIAMMVKILEAGLNLRIHFIKSNITDLFVSIIL
jgi:hypothetical protein